MLPAKNKPLPVAQAKRRRSELVETCDVPIQSEVREQLGPVLANIFFESLSSECKTLMGLTPPLVGPDIIWVSPDSRIKDKVRCTPVPDPRSIILKTFSHKTILELGQKHICFLENKFRLENEDALRQQAYYLELECNRRMVEALEEARQEHEKKTEEVVGTLMEHFDKCFQEVVEKMELRMRKEYQKQVEEGRSEVASFMLVQLQEEVERKELELCDDFHETLIGEINIVTSRFLQQIETERNIAIQSLRDTIDKYERMLTETRAQLENGAVVDICRAVVHERDRCKKHLRQLESACDARVNELEETIAELNDKNRILENTISGKTKRIYQLGTKIRILAKEFQKFINFCSEAMPAHAEFLLSIEKFLEKQLYDEENPPLIIEKPVEETVQLFPPPLPIDQDATPPKICDRLLAKKATSGVRKKGKGLEKRKSSKELECKHTFNYYRFKYSLLKDFSRRDEPANITQTGPRVGKKEKQDEKVAVESKDTVSLTSMDTSNQLYQKLKLVGEEEREHLGPEQEFLNNRLNTLLKICRQDPELAKSMLGK